MLKDKHIPAFIANALYITTIVFVASNISYNLNATAGETQTVTDTEKAKARVIPGRRFNNGPPHTLED